MLCVCDSRSSHWVIDYRSRIECCLHTSSHWVNCSWNSYLCLLEIAWIRKPSMLPPMYIYVYIYIYMCICVYVCVVGSLYVQPAFFMNSRLSTDSWTAGSWTACICLQMLSENTNANIHTYCHRYAQVTHFAFFAFATSCRKSGCLADVLGLSPLRYHAICKLVQLKLDTATACPQGVYIYAPRSPTSIYIYIYLSLYLSLYI